MTSAATVDMTDERMAFVDALRTFAAGECGSAERLEELTSGHEHSHNVNLCHKLGELGYIGVGIPEEHGGGGGTIVDTCLLVEELFYAKVPVTGLYTSLTVAETVERHAQGDLKDQLLRSICDGDVHVLGFSEPEAGSDLASLRCSAKRVDGGWTVNGQKTWTTNAHFGDHVLLMVRTGEPGSRHKGITMLSLPMDTEGIEVRGIDSHGGRAFDDALAYVKEREQFGRAIGSFQAIKHRLADLATELECCRLLVYDVAQRTEAEPDKVLPREASMVKLKVTETAKRVALECMQSMGGYGYASEYGMERHVRNTLASTIYGGASEVQRDIIGKTYGL